MKNLVQRELLRDINKVNIAKANKLKASTFGKQSQNPSTNAQQHEKKLKNIERWKVNIYIYILYKR